MSAEKVSIAPFQSSQSKIFSKIYFLVVVVVLCVLSKLRLCC